MEVKAEWKNLDQETSQRILPDGEYDFEVLKAEPQTSQAGNEMLKLMVRVFDGNGNKIQLFDYLVASDKAAWKIAQFCKATGMESKLDADGELLADDVKGRTGVCRVVVDDDDQWGTRNQIGGYVVDTDAETDNQADHKPVREMPPDNSEIPF